VWSEYFLWIAVIVFGILFFVSLCKWIKKRKENSDIVKNIIKVSTCSDESKILYIIQSNAMPGRFLVFDHKKWKCLHFIYRDYALHHSIDQQNMAFIKTLCGDYFDNSINPENIVLKVVDGVDCEVDKFSINYDSNIRYHFKFCYITIKNNGKKTAIIKQLTKEKTLIFGSHCFYWLTLQEMKDKDSENNGNKNRPVIDHVIKHAHLFASLESIQ